MRPDSLPLPSLPSLFRNDRPKSQELPNLRTGRQTLARATLGILTLVLWNVWPNLMWDGLGWAESQELGGLCPGTCLALTPMVPVGHQGQLFPIYTALLHLH